MGSAAAPISNMMNSLLGFIPKLLAFVIISKFDTKENALFYRVLTLTRSIVAILLYIYRKKAAAAATAKKTIP